MIATVHTISIRVATPDDDVLLARLAQLDSAEVPRRPLLIAERDGVAQAALSLADGSSIADPFARTAELISLLRMRAARLTPHESLPARIRSALSIRRRSRAYAA